MSKVDTEVSAPDGNPSEIKCYFPQKLKSGSLQLLDRCPCWKLEDQILGSVERSLDERNAPVIVAILLAISWPGNHRDISPGRGFPRGPGQEESVRTLAVVSEAFDADSLGVGGKDIPGDVMEKVDKFSNFLDGGCCPLVSHT